MSSRLPPSDTFYYDWPCSLEIDRSGNFVVTAFHLEGCRGVHETKELAVEAVRTCIQSYVAADVGSDDKFTKAEPVEAISARVIGISVNISSPPKA